MALSEHVITYKLYSCLPVFNKISIYYYIIKLDLIFLIFGLHFQISGSTLCIHAQSFNKVGRVFIFDIFFG